MRLANEIAAAAMDYCREHLRPGMKESEAGAMWNGFVHGAGTGWNGRVELALGFSLVWSGPGIKTFTATGDLPVQEDEPTLFEIWVCADGYWCDHTKNLCPGELRAEYAELEHALSAVYERALAHCRPGASLPELDRLVREGIAEAGYPGQPTHPIAHGVGARAHEPPYAHQAGGGTIEEGMVLAIEPGIYWEGGGGLRLEDNFLVTANGVEKLSAFPDGVPVVLGDARKPRLDAVDPEVVQQTGDLQLLLGVEHHADRLFAVAKGRVVEADRAAEPVGIVELACPDHPQTTPSGKEESFSAPFGPTRKLSSTRRPPPPSQ